MSHGFNTPDRVQPYTPAGISLTGETRRCPDCDMPGALIGYRDTMPVILCRHCGAGYGKDPVFDQKVHRGVTRTSAIDTKGSGSAPAKKVTRIRTAAGPRARRSNHDNPEQIAATKKIIDQAMAAIAASITLSDLSVVNLSLAIGEHPNFIHGFRSDVWHDRAGIRRARRIIDGLEKFSRKWMAQGARIRSLQIDIGGLERALAEKNRELATLTSALHEVPES